VRIFKESRRGFLQSCQVQERIEVYIDNSPDLVIQEVLNMYLLQKPPVNPASIKAARRKALAGQRENSAVSVRKD
jgi:hypothetical protein